MRISEFINKVRGSDESVKRRWLIVLSGSTMLLVVFLWVLYFNIALPEVSPPVAADQSPAHKQGSTVEQNNKLGNLKRTLAAGFSVIKEKLGRKNSIIIDNTERNFILEGVEEIPKITLP